MSNIKDDYKKEQVIKSLLTPIEKIKGTRGYDQGEPAIFIENSIIQSTQRYYSGSDPDMKDLTVEFYEIIYKDKLEYDEGKFEKVLNGKYFCNKIFAGDTMNSFNTFANNVPEAGTSRTCRTAKESWPKYLQKYYDRYHCLANFWILPMWWGRDTNLCEYCKAPKGGSVGDYMDRYLQKLIDKKVFEKKEYNYFKCFNDFDDFIEKHYLDAYAPRDENNERKIDYYSNFKKLKKDPETFVIAALKKIEKRAADIAEDHCDELWERFNKYNLFD